MFRPGANTKLAALIPDRQERGGGGGGGGGGRKKQRDEERGGRTNEIQEETEGENKRNIEGDSEKIQRNPERWEGDEFKQRWSWRTRRRGGMR